MVSLNWSRWVILILVTAVSSTELVPERFLRPRDFNHHPFTDVGGPPTPKPLAALTTQSNPYAVLSQKKPREGREFARQDVIFYPSPHPSVLSAKKYLQTNEVGKYDDPYAKIPKNYAFSYIVRDHQSGDDFSHSQAHNGKATRGQYRVKLPDGRIQVVSYTADHKGYRADVQYEDDQSSKASGIILQSVHGNLSLKRKLAPNLPPKPIKKYQPQLNGFHFIPTYSAEVSNQLNGHDSVLPRDYLKLVFTHMPQSGGPIHYLDYTSGHASSTALPYSGKEQFVSTTPGYDEPYQHQLVTPAPKPYVRGRFSGSIDVKAIASPSPSHVTVTPRTLLGSIAITKNDLDARIQHPIYKYV